eukprot:TRINITY_DN3820_c0_g1_i1.p1 TRINITY_DN3820_c0_g1~~TRINITY_DN3820_c0_g1_i1.p1  ORF type:complete len:351 (+),score=104.52 TRINITY_DN3820_c0_g1_i1:20-1072(+)
MPLVHVYSSWLNDQLLDCPTKQAQPSFETNVDHEEIRINLSKVPTKITTLVLITCPTTSETAIKDAYVRILDHEDAEFCRYDVPNSELTGHRFLSKLSRVGRTRWTITALGETMKFNGTGFSFKHIAIGVCPFLDDKPEQRRLRVEIHDVVLEQCRRRAACVVHVLFDKDAHTTRTRKMSTEEDVGSRLSVDASGEQRLKIISSSESDAKQAFFELAGSRGKRAHVPGIACACQLKGNARWIEFVLAEPARSVSGTLTESTKAVATKSLPLKFVGSSGSLSSSSSSSSSSSASSSSSSSSSVKISPKRCIGHAHVHIPPKPANIERGVASFDMRDGQRAFICFSVCDVLE